MNEFVKMLAPSLKYINHIIRDDKIIFTIASDLEQAKFPYCDNPSSKVHSFYQKEFQDLPMQGRQVIFLLNNRKFFCTNPACPHKTFAERYDFISEKAKKTNRLIEKILMLSAGVSSISASKILKSEQVSISKSSICSLLKKMPNIVDKHKIVKICVDDFAIKKRNRYGTIMVDVESHRVIDILESRETEAVTEWLKQFPNIQVVSRDGSQAYASAIN